MQVVLFQAEASTYRSLYYNDKLGVIVVCVICKAKSLYILIFFNAAIDLTYLDAYSTNGNDSYLDGTEPNTYITRSVIGRKYIISIKNNKICFEHRIYPTKRRMCSHFWFKLFLYHIKN
jgi:hypothetical protein